MLGAQPNEAVNGRLFRSNDVLPFARKGDRVRHAFSILVLGILMLIAGRPASAQVLNQYTTTTAGAITDLSCNQPLASQIVRTFNVATSYIVGDIDLGIRLEHTYRADLRITLRSPAGTTVQVMWGVGGSGNNLHDRFDDEAATNISAHNGTVTDPTTPTGLPYSHSFRPTQPFTAFDGQNAAGNWTLVICDAAGVDTGTFRRADLFITSISMSVTKISSVISDGVSLSNPKAIPGAVVRYCVLVTNNGGIPMTNVAPSDTLPATLTYVAGSLLSGTSCAGAVTAEDDNNSGADESDPFGMAVSGSTITGNAPSLDGGTSFALVFRATVN